MKKKFKVIPLLGDVGDQETQWWTEERWQQHWEYVAKLKSEGRYLEPQPEVTFNYDTDDFKYFEHPPLMDSLSNFGLLIPNNGKVKCTIGESVTITINENSHTPIKNKDDE